MTAGSKGATLATVEDVRRICAEMINEFASALTGSASGSPMPLSPDGASPEVIEKLDKTIAAFSPDSAPDSSLAGAASDAPECPQCEGTGSVEDDATGALGYVVSKPCPECLRPDGEHKFGCDTGKRGSAKEGALTAEDWRDIANGREAPGVYERATGALTSVEAEVERVLLDACLDVRGSDRDVLDDIVAIVKREREALERDLEYTRSRLNAMLSAAAAVLEFDWGDNYTDAIAAIDALEQAMVKP